MLAGLAGAIVDYRRTLSRVPPVPALCPTPSERCETGRVARLDARNERRLALESDFSERSWFYALGVLGGALGLAAVSLRKRREPSERQRTFADLGVGGVVLGLVVAGLFWLVETGSQTIQPGALPAFFPSAVMLAVAAVGGLQARAESGRPLEVEGELRRLAWYVALAGPGLTAVTIAIGWVAWEWVACDHPRSTVLDYLFWAALATSAAAGLFALVGLLVRRWPLALFCFVVNPILLLGIVLHCSEP